MHIIVTGLGQLPLVPVFARPHQRNIGCDAVYPGTNIRLSAKASKIAVGGHESVLRCVFSVGVVAQDALGQVENEVTVLLDNIFKGIFYAFFTHAFVGFSNETFWAIVHLIN